MKKTPHEGGDGMPYSAPAQGGEAGRMRPHDHYDVVA
jgi:hypothetical protein